MTNCTVLSTKMQLTFPKMQLTFPEIISVLLKCLPRPRIGVVHVPLVISGLDNARDLIQIDLKKDNCFY